MLTYVHLAEIKDFVIRNFNLLILQIAEDPLNKLQNRTKKLFQNWNNKKYF